MNRVAAGAAVVHWNELSTLALQNHARAGLTGMRTRLYGGTPQKFDHRAQLGISWDPVVFTELAWTYEAVIPRGVLGVTPPRGILSVLLEHNTTGLRHWEEVTHAPHHIEDKGVARVRGALTGQNTRARRVFAACAVSMVAHAAGLPIVQPTMTSRFPGHPVFLTGDLNVDYLAEVRRLHAGLPLTPWFPLTVLRRVATPVNPVGGTHGPRLIDQGWVRGALTVTAVRILPRGTSDHNPVEWEVTQ